MASLRFGKHRGERRSTSFSLNAFSCVGGAGEQPRGHRFGAARHFAFRCFDAPRLVRHAAKATRPVPSRCTMAATEISAKANEARSRTFDRSACRQLAWAKSQR